MKIYLIRHGIAAERGESWPDDTKRPLTQHGTSRFRREVKALVELDIAIDQIISSGLVRARQTAELLSDGLPGKPPMAMCEALAPGGSAAAVLDELGKYARLDRVALVGHEPDLGNLAAKLIGAGAPLDFKKGAICRVDVGSVPPAKRGTLKWFVTPKMLRRIGKGK